MIGMTRRIDFRMSACPSNTIIGVKKNFYTIIKVGKRSLALYGGCNRGI